MGYRVFLLAVTGKEPAVVQREMNLTATDEFLSDPPDSPVCGTVLPGGAYLLYFKLGYEPESVMLSKLSKSASLLTCHVNETVMASHASGWIDGREHWSVLHDCDRASDNLETTGELPAPFQAIRDRLLEQQHSANDCDYVFDVPVELFAAMGGIRYDDDLDTDREKPWQVLAPQRKSALSGFRQWWPFR